MVAPATKRPHASCANGAVPASARGDRYSGRRDGASSAGLEVHACLDERSYERGVKVSDAQLAAVNLTRDELHPEWNYMIHPHDRSGVV